jgi:hypothetical protein
MSTRPKPPPIERLIDIISKPVRRPTPTPGWAHLCEQHQCICIECFRLFTTTGLDVDFIAARQEWTREKLLPGIASIELGVKGELTWVLCLNEYCIPARQRLWESIQRGLVRPGVKSPISDVEQVSGLRHTGMHMPEGGESDMADIERRRYPHLSVDTSTIPKSGRGVFTAITLQPGQVVCSVLGQIRGMDETSKDSEHALSLDVGSFNGVAESHVYGLRLFRQGIAGLINSSRMGNGTPSNRRSNCIFTEHPHFREQEGHYLERAVWPSGAMCVMVNKSQAVLAGEELLIDYKWSQQLWTKPPSSRQ